MSQRAIIIENLSKQYSRGGNTTSGNLRDWWAEKQLYSKSNKFWALKGIEFSVGEGEIIGIIGRNGSGKSTLLKILSRVTLPTSGQVKMRGKVTSLLEVGTGFHPELTGRENVYLNGTILGMKRDEINKRYDEIVAFSGVEDFMESKVKHYSSGMYVRLAFSVAAHLRTDILLVDEVLAVGDAEFQKKSLGKMDEVVRETGRTILFVSHNLGLVQQLCNRVVGLDSGKVFADTSPNKAITDYYKLISQVDLPTLKMRGTLQNSVSQIEITLNHHSLYKMQGVSLASDLEFMCTFHHTILQPVKFHIAVFREGVRLCTFQDVVNFSIASSITTSVFKIAAGQLRPGRYILAVGGLVLHNLGEYFWADEAGTFTILEDWQTPNDPINYGWIAPSADSRRLP